MPMYRPRKTLSDEDELSDCELDARARMLDDDDEMNYEHAPAPETFLRPAKRRRSDDKYAFIETHVKSYARFCRGGVPLIA